MSVIVIQVIDNRIGCYIGIGYLKVKRFVVNFLLTQFQDSVDIYQHRLGKDNKVVIGQVMVRVSIDVPMHAVPKLMQTSNIPNNPTPVSN